VPDSLGRGPRLVLLRRLGKPVVLG
jgi:hypothetical protein